MTTDYHTPILSVPPQAANAATVNGPLGQLDAGIGQAYAVADSALSFAVNNNAELVAARSPYPSLDARLDALVLTGGNVSTTTNGVSAAGQNVLTVHSTTGFVVGANVGYPLAGGGLEGNTIASINAGVSLVLTINIGTGGVLSDMPVSLIDVLFLSGNSAGPLITLDEVLASFTVPAGYTCLYNNMSVAPGVTVTVAGLLVNPGWS